MATSASSFNRDANRIPITENGLQVSKSVTFSANGTVAVPLFHVVGTIECLSLYGVVTTAIGSNHTAAYWRINDQTITSQVISLATGTTVSSLPAGTVLSRRSLVSVALTASTSATGLVTDPVAATVPSFFMPFLVTQKTGGIETNIEYVYTTNNNSAGAITFYCGFVPLSPDGDVVVY
jgi:hypothetical protein